MKEIGIFLEVVKLAEKQSHLNLALFPLSAPDGGSPDYLTLDEAMKQGVITITEVSEGGSVPDLKVINLGSKNILILEGEELVGAKQNRIVNSTFLLSGKCEVVIPVSCVEEGRWHYISPRFDAGGKIMPASIRGYHEEAVLDSLDRDEGFRSNQGMIWEELSAKVHRLKADSPTHAMSDLFEQQETKISDYLKAFRVVEGQIGAVLALNGRVVGMEYLGYHETFVRFFPKIVKSYALDAIDWLEQPPYTIPKVDSVRRFLNSVAQAEGKSRPSLGLGQDLRFESKSIVGSALEHNGRLLHLSAFKKQGDTPSNRKSNYQRFSERRRRRI